jgi:hypothetical protein
MCARLGVKRGTKGVGKAWGREEYPNLVTVFDMAKSDFRHMNLDTVQSVTAKGNMYYVIE